MKKSFYWLAAVVLALVLLPSASRAEDPRPDWQLVNGGVLLTVVPPERIPPINAPEFVLAAEAERFMKDNEPVLGFFDGRVAKAYSLWLLDRHEVVNDSTPTAGPIAVTW